MLVGQHLGPFAIEKELGAGAMGTVYLGRFLKDGQALKKGEALAIKVMAPTLGGSNPTAVARFEREAQILKQLRHPNIVRLYGVGKTQNVRYYAMELLDGESLDHVLARRGRMTWEEIVTVGKQLCDALYHAHQAGVVHRDLKPSNLMILRDGTLKLTDFGIAKDLDVTALTSANCTVGTASYMSPEQCKGERDITPKSDLYSLGIVFYELITGEKPFHADNVMEMFTKHVKAKPERPSRLVLDLPVWMDTLILQMMEKNPEHRPLNADAVGKALEEIQEKVQAQMSAGVDVVRGRRADRPRGKRRLDRKDRETARTLAGRKEGKRAPFYTSLWFVALGVALILGGMGTALYFVLRPPAAETLYAEAEGLMKSGERADHDKALEGPIRAYLDHYRRRAGEQTDQILAWEAQVETEQANEKVMRYVTRKREDKPYGALSETEEHAFAGAWAVEQGEFSEALETWKKVQKAEGANAWGQLADAYVQALKGRQAQEEAFLRDYRQDVVERGQEPAVTDPSYRGLKQQAFVGVRLEHLGKELQPPERGDLARAARVFADLKEQAEEELTRGHLAALPWWVFGAAKAEELKEKRADADKVADEYREELIRKAAAQALVLARTPEGVLQARALAMTVLTLYGNDPEDREAHAEALEQSQQLLDALRAQNLPYRLR